jgi:hypothetical protein
MVNGLNTKIGIFSWRKQFEMAARSFHEIRARNNAQTIAFIGLGFTRRWFGMVKV